MTDRTSDAALWQSVQRALVEVVLPALPTGHAQDVARQMVGLAAYAAARGSDPTPDRARRLAELTGLGPGSSWSEVAGAASGMLTAPGGGDAGLRSPLRQTLLGYLVADSDAAQPLLDTFARHGKAVGTPPKPFVVETAPLERWLSDQQLGGHRTTRVRITSATAMPGGHSRRMLDVRIDTVDGPRSLVVRVEQGGVFGTDGATEAAIMQAIGAAGVATAPIVAIEPTGHVLGHPFFVMERVAGGDAEDPQSMRSYLLELHALHQVPVRQVAAGFASVPTSPEGGVDAAIRHWEHIYRSAVHAPIPLLDEGAAWLRRHLRPSGPLVVVHGDPGPGNFLALDGRVTALTDWEFAHIGDPAEDWAYLSAVRGARLHDEATWRELIREAVGVSYAAETWTAWTVYNVFKGACANLTALRVFNDGTAGWPNLLAVGTAVHLRFLRRLADLVG